jgi:hypothetical protein
MRESDQELIKLLEQMISLNLNDPDIYQFVIDELLKKCGCSREYINRTVVKLIEKYDTLQSM